ncbi:protein containing DNA ligase, partial [mine drainage metagenome]
LSQGALRPEYEAVELGVAASLARRAVAGATGAPESTVARRTQTTGDLGTTAFELVTALHRLDAGEPLTVEEVYRTLCAVAAAAGAGSQEVKVERLAALLGRASALEAKYLVRFVLGTLRVGVREMSILDALSMAFADGSKDARSRIEAAYNWSSDLGLVAGALVSGGLPALDAIRLE